jgi:hypothetical protein
LKRPATRGWLVFAAVVLGFASISRTISVVLALWTRGVFVGEAVYISATVT